VAVDFESARSAGGGDHPIQIGIVESRELTLLHDSFFVSFLQPPEPVILTRGDVHGIQGKDLNESPSLLSLWPEISTRLQKVPLVAHGAGTERRFLRAFPFAHLGPWVDTLQWSRKLYPGMPSYALGDMVKTLGLEKEVTAACPGRFWHDALFDAVACLILLHGLIRNGGLENQPPPWEVSER
jgi:DNA polymerase-3 subunit epsilon